MLVMLMKLNPKDNSDLKEFGVWQTGYSWFDEGEIHPITARVFYTTPGYEVVDVSLEFDKFKVDLPGRMTTMIVASAIEEYASAATDMKKAYEQKQKAAKMIDPYFEE